MKQLQLRIPLHLKAGDSSGEAVLQRIELLQRMSSLTGGRGFRYPSKKRRVSTRYEKMARIFETKE